MLVPCLFRLAIRTIAPQVKMVSRIPVGTDIAINFATLFFLLSELRIDSVGDRNEMEKKKNESTLWTHS